MSHEDAERILESIPAYPRTASPPEAQRRIEAMLVLLDTPPERIKQALVAAFGEID